MEQAVGGLGRNGALLIVAAPYGKISISPLDLIISRRRIQGWPSGDAHDSEATLRFSALSDIRPMIETYPLTEAAAAYARMLDNEARFRVVLVPEA